jgi:AcrR family transcriptional regulator
MRSRLLDAASTLFKIHGLNGTSVTEIAGAADAFPSQVTYYFRTKEALFVEAACRDILHIAERAEKVASRARTPKAYTESVIDTLIEAEGLVLFVEALILARQRPDLIPEIARTMDRLHVEATRAHAEKMARHGWHTRIHPMSSPAGFGRLRSAPRSRVTLSVGARRQCPMPCARRWVCWVKRVPPSLHLRRRFGSSLRLADRPQSRVEVPHVCCNSRRFQPHCRPPARGARSTCLALLR